MIQGIADNPPFQKVATKAIVARTYCLGVNWANAKRLRAEILQEN